MQDKRLSVSQLNTYIKNVFDDELILKNITVFGEISEKSESGGNVFFTLKDEGSILRSFRTLRYSRNGRKRIGNGQCGLLC